MRFRRFLSGLLFGLGCALAFVGLLALLLPEIPNQQLKLVLASFSMPSENGAVMLMNTAMSFALANSWRVLGLGAVIAVAGAWLLVRFTPVQRPKPQPSPVPQQPIVSRPEAAPVSKPAVEPVNPFATGAYSDHLPARPRGAVKSFVTHAAPILEPNRIEENDVHPLEQPAPEPADAQPYFYSRFSAEARAIETEVGAPSQSGSRVLIRTPAEFASPAEETPVPRQEIAVEETLSKPETPAATLSTPAPMAPFSPRIRSTMGQRSAKRNLPTTHP